MNWSSRNEKVGTVQLHARDQLNKERTGMGEDYEQSSNPVRGKVKDEALGEKGAGVSDGC